MSQRTRWSGVVGCAWLSPAPPSSRRSWRPPRGYSRGVRANPERDGGRGGSGTHRVSRLRAEQKTATPSSTSLAPRPRPSLAAATTAVSSSALPTATPPPPRDRGSCWPRSPEVPSPRSTSPAPPTPSSPGSTTAASSSAPTRRTRRAAGPVPGRRAVGRRQMPGGGGHQRARGAARRPRHRRGRHPPGRPAHRARLPRRAPDDRGFDMEGMLDFYGAELWGVAEGRSGYDRIRTAGGDDLGAA